MLNIESFDVRKVHCIVRAAYITIKRRYTRHVFPNNDHPCILPRTVTNYYLLPVQRAAPVLYMNKKHLEKGTGNTSVAMALGKKGGTRPRLPAFAKPANHDDEEEEKEKSQLGRRRREKGKRRDL